MAWLPSHQELRNHPKTKRAARKAGVSLPTMIGHLHMLWWWALDHAPDGDLGKYDADDLADAAMWDNDPVTFVEALRDCGPAGSQGFIDDNDKLHDWDDYGGKYGQRVQSARKAAAARWHPEDDADAMRTQCDGNADAQGVACGPQSVGNAEERRVEKKPLGEDKPRKPKDRDLLFEAVIGACGLALAELTKSARGAANKAAKELREVGATPEGIHARAKVHRTRWPDAECTPSSLAKNYAQLGTSRDPARPPPDPDACHDCNQPLEGHDGELCAILARAG